MFLGLNQSALSLKVIFLKLKVLCVIIGPGSFLIQIYFPTETDYLHLHQNQIPRGHFVFMRQVSLIFFLGKSLISTVISVFGLENTEVMILKLLLYVKVEPSEYK